MERATRPSRSATCRPAVPSPKQIRLQYSSTALASVCFATFFRHVLKRQGAWKSRNRLGTSQFLDNSEVGTPRRGVQVGAARRPHHKPRCAPGGRVAAKSSGEAFLSRMARTTRMASFFGGEKTQRAHKGKPQRNPESAADDSLETGGASAASPQSLPRTCRCSRYLSGTFLSACCSLSAPIRWEGRGPG